MIEKQMFFHADKRQVDFDITFHWDKWDVGTLRLGHFTLLPDSFSMERLKFVTTNGGGKESYSLHGRAMQKPDVLDAIAAKIRAAL